MAERKEFYIRISGQLVSVTKEIYYAHHQMRRREKYLEERDEEHGKVNYNALDTDEYGGEEIIEDKSSDVEAEVMENIILEKLHSSLCFLTNTELDLIIALFYDGYSEREWSAKTGIPNMTIHDRKVKILVKLKKLLES